MKLIPILVSTVLMGGCVTGGTLPANPSKMSAEQLKEWVKDKNANAGCLVANTPYGKGNSVFLALDKGIVVNGTITIKDNCEIVIQNAPAAAPSAPRRTDP
jgi:hypothetical protein